MTITYLKSIDSIFIIRKYIIIDDNIIIKKNDNIKKTFIFFKNKTVATIWAIIVTCTVGFANIFTILQPAIETKDYVSTGFQLAGPIVFGLIAFFLISKYEKRYGRNKDSIDKIA